MKRILIAIAAIALFVLNTHAEQTNRVEFIWDEARLRDNVPVPALVRSADVAGIGEFLNQPTAEHPYASMDVGTYWIGDPGTNIVNIKVGPRGTDWVFPTNSPVVFFARTLGSVLTNNFSDVGNVPPVDTTGIDLSELLFPHGDDAWFRTTRDNGLLYAFATNLWECIRINPDQERFYEVLRDAGKLPYEASSRISEDTTHELGFLLKEFTDASLLEKNADPLIGARTKSMIFHEFIWRGWSRTNGVYYPPPVQ